eukprot:7546752-Alexandrium_andersonii.AAC.1
MSDQELPGNHTTWKSDLPGRCFGPDPGGGRTVDLSRSTCFDLGARWFRPRRSTCRPRIAI